MIEVCNCGEGHRTRLRESTCVYGVPLASVYKGWRRRRPVKAIGAARVWSPTRTPSPSRSPPRGERGRRKEEKERGLAPFSLVQFGPEGRGAQPALWPISSFQ